MTNEIQSADTASATRQRRALGLTGQGAGVVGIVVSVLLIVAVLFARGWAVDAVSGISTRIDTNLAKGVPLLEAASTKVADVSSRVSAVSDAASKVAAVAAPGTALVDRLSGELSGLSEKYLALRADYANAHAAITTTLDQLKTLDALVPFIEIPQGPVDALGALDDRIKQLDDTVMGVLGANPGSGIVATAAGAIADKLTGLEGRLAEVSSKIQDANTRLQNVRTEVASTADTVTTGINIVAILMIIGLVYLVALHVVLYRSAKGYARAPAA